MPPTPKAKDKDYGLLQRMYQMMKNNVRYIVVATILIVVLYLGINHFSSHASIGLSPDRSESYNVKVLPASLGDAELNKLTKDAFSYLAMIDAGSSGCRAHVYRYGKLGTISGPLYILPQHDSKKVKPGLSSFASHPQDAGASLEGLIDFMKQQVPEADWPVTPIWLKATAGLRMLPAEQSEAVLESIRSYLGDKTKSPFLFRPAWARIIPGNEEGGFGWIAYNYLKRIIGPKRSPYSTETPYAVVEMGGASAQVSQVAPSAAAAQLIPPQYRFTFTIEKETYQLYTHSYLGFGGEQGRMHLNKYLIDMSTHSGAALAAAMIQDPCLNPGYTRTAAEGPATEVYQGPNCVASVQGWADKDPSCAISLGSIIKAFTFPDSPSATCNPATQPSPYSFGCVHQPDFVAASPNFLTFENFYYVASALGVKSVNGSATSFPLVTTPQLILDAGNEVCKMDWKDVQAVYPKDGQGKDVTQKLCFLANYAYALLVDGLKISKDKHITIQREVGTSEIEWALGAAYKEAAELLKRTHLRQGP